jgi:RNA polymerase sigma-70 factor (ECF subfamily)
VVSETRSEPEQAVMVAALRDGDEAAFAVLFERYRRQLHVHCYRMLGSFHDAEDMVQETFLRAWRARASFEGRSLVRTWLYRIATNVCLNALERRPRALTPPDVVAAADASLDTLTPPAWRPDLPWLEPYPDELLEPAAPVEVQPDSLAVARETIELAYLVALQHLPGRQRAVLILRDALGWSEQETASLLETSVAAVKSAHQRARATMRELLPGHRLEWAASEPNAEERAVLKRFMAAYDRTDAAALTDLLCEDARQAMPPALLWFDGREAIVAHFRRLMDGTIGDFRLLATSANSQPAAAAYLRAPGDTAFRLSGLNVLRVENGRIAEITSFGPELCRPFRLPATL